MTDTKVPVKLGTKPTAVAPRSDIASPFGQLRREIDQLFESFGFGARLPALRAVDFDAPWQRLASLDVMPAVDVVERPAEYEISTELPGLDEKDVEVKLANGVLTIKGEKRESKEEKEKDYYFSERRFGTFSRSFRVPEGVDTGKVEASFTKGVLTVKLPKSAEAKNNEKKIEVKAA